MKLAALGWMLTLATSVANAADISPNEAANHVGQAETVCGTVASAHYAPRSRGQPTFLNLGHAYPNEDFTAVIWGESRAQFGTPEDLEGHRICVTGPIKLYRGKPEVILEGPSQLKE
jgi:DNA/RNA endonuclease YhcR with UshA esterase domain